MAHKLKIIPLGGVGEIGKNMTVIEYNKDIIVVDCGLSFPDEDMLGIDMVIPDMEYLEKNADKIRGFLITHGHEDHIGALPFALQRFNVPVYGSRLTIALIEHKLDEARVRGAQLNRVAAGETITLGCFRIEFIKTSHSIGGAFALAIITPIGTVIHTGDFKVDYTPIDGEPIDIARLAHYGTSGVLALLSDSTNVERPGHTQSEREIGKTFEYYFDNAKGRVIVATFASNIYRIQQVADVAIAHGRVICMQGRSVENIYAIATELGYLSIPQDKIVSVDQLKRYKPEQVCVITTGTQGEPMSGLFRMANSLHRLNIHEGDMVIISASAIPGNERGVAKVINQLYGIGAKVIYDRTADVHVSGHAQREELRLMFTLAKPRFFIPLHGEFRHLCQHAELAEQMGMPRADIFVTECGEVVELTRTKGMKNGTVPTGSIMIDGLGIGDIGNVVLKDRRVLSEDGLFMVVLAKRFEEGHKSEWSSIKNGIRSEMRDFLYDKTKRRPMILPLIIEI